GAVSLARSDYTRVCGIFLQLAQQAIKGKRKAANVLSVNGGQFPIWGTCLGMEVIVYLLMNKTDAHFQCKAVDMQNSFDFIMSDSDLRTKTSLFANISSDELKVSEYIYEI